MDLPDCNNRSCSNQIRIPHKGICPSGWHIPTNAEWDILIRYADGTSGTGGSYSSPTAARYLKASSGWNGDGNGEDFFNFSALPGGFGGSDGYFGNAGYLGYWWSATENYSFYAYSRFMYYNYEGAYWYIFDKNFLFSVRCLQD